MVSFKTATALLLLTLLCGGQAFAHPGAPIAGLYSGIFVYCTLATSIRLCNLQDASAASRSCNRQVGRDCASDIPEVWIVQGKEGSCFKAHNLAPTPRPLLAPSVGMATLRRSRRQLLRPALSVMVAPSLKRLPKLMPQV